MIPPLTASVTPPVAANSPGRIRQAASQFEALLMAQILKSARSEGDSWLGTGADSTADSAMEMAMEHFAQALAAQGGLGLASMVAKGLDSKK